MPKEFEIHRDRYSGRRGGKSQLYEISCAIMVYQKDGKGSLIRCYTDRILKTQNIDGLDQEEGASTDVSGFKALNCGNCHNLIGTSMVYKPEDRPAFQMIRGTFSRKPYKPIK